MNLRAAAASDAAFFGFSADAAEADIPTDSAPAAVPVSTSAERPIESMVRGFIVLVLHPRLSRAESWVASASTSESDSRKASSASVTSCCAERLWTAEARRRRRWRSVSSRSVNAALVLFLVAAFTSRTTPATARGGSGSGAGARAPRARGGVVVEPRRDRVFGVVLGRGLPLADDGAARARRQRLGSWCLNH